jgi:glycosyltransferase involved in cell wall biosynthesis
VVKYGDKISVIIPNYNRARSIRRAIEGVLAQTYREIEVIVVDDCSTDASVEIIEAVAAADPRVRLVRQPRNGGAAHARTAGIEAATSELIAFQDSDDNWLPDKLETQMRAFAELPEEYVALFGPEIIYGRDGEGSGKKYGPRRTACVPGPNVRIESGDLSGHFVRANIMTLQTVLLKKAAFVSAGGFDPRLRNNEDWDFNIRLSRQGPMGFIEAPLVVVSDSPDGISKNRKASVFSYLVIFNKLRRMGVEERALAPHALSASRQLMRHGRPAASRRYLKWTMAREPSRPGHYLRYALSLHPPLYRAVMERRGKRRRAGAG